MLKFEGDEHGLIRKRCGRGEWAVVKGDIEGEGQVEGAEKIVGDLGGWRWEWV